jgi:Predicted metal-binding protein related to the C-terminal domain of SecA
VPITPDRYSTVSVTELLSEASKGRIGLDQRWVRSIVERGEQAVDELVAFGLREPDEDQIDLEEDLVAMLRYLRSPKALPYLIELVRRHPDGVMDDVIEAILEFGAASLDPLLDLYNELGPEQGGEVAFLLAGLGVHDPRIREILVSRLSIDTADAAISLALYHDPETKPALEEKLSALDREDPALESDRQELRHAIAALEEPRPEPFREPFDIWSLYPKEATPSIADLSWEDRIEFLESSSAEHREAAVLSFVNKELQPELRDRLFAVARGDAEPRVRAAAWRVLGESSDDKSIRAAMLERLKDEAAPVVERAGALVGLSSDATAEVIRFMTDFYERPETRAAALEAMWHSLDRRFSDYFPRHLDDPDLEIRRQAVWGVGYLGLHSEASRIRKFFEDEELREDALFAYALSVPAEISRGRIRGVFRKIAEDAGGLSELEEELVQVALDQRLAMHGYDPVFFTDNQENQDSKSHGGGSKEPGRNDPCPCGSGKKYKKCHGA